MLHNYFVATLSRYEIVQADGKEAAIGAARAKGLKGKILTIRQPTTDELRLMEWHNEMMEREQNRQ